MGEGWRGFGGCWASGHEWASRHEGGRQQAPNAGSLSSGCAWAEPHTLDPFRKMTGSWWYGFVCRGVSGREAALGWRLTRRSASPAGPLSATLSCTVPAPFWAPAKADSSTAAVCTPAGVAPLGALSDRGPGGPRALCHPALHPDGSHLHPAPTSAALPPSAAGNVVERSSIAQQLLSDPRDPYRWVFEPG